MKLLRLESGLIVALLLVAAMHAQTPTGGIEDVSRHGSKRCRRARRRSHRS